MVKQSSLKSFFIKLISITIAIILIINVVYNLFLADKMEALNKLISLDKSKFRSELRDKVRNEIRDGLKKEKILNKEDKILLYKLYIKIKNEFKDLDTSN
jgi:hypothetical protein|tara:strand:- start:318 stop:617 length:300 start_codon:yes stop_codon:yes gene_type:complete